MRRMHLAADERRFTPIKNKLPYLCSSAFICGPESFFKRLLEKLYRLVETIHSSSAAERAMGFAFMLLAAAALAAREATWPWVTP